MEEIEIKFLNIDPKIIEEKLLSIGAKKASDYHFKRIIFDYSDFRLDKQGAWIRLRDEGDKVTLAFKQRISKNYESLAGDEGMYEREIIVSDFESTRDILLKTGLIEKTYQENKRIKYLLDEVECDIDYWPLLNPFIEIEGKTWDQVYTFANKLGLAREDAKIFSVNQIFRLQGLDDRNYTKLTFSEQVERVDNRF